MNKLFPTCHNKPNDITKQGNTWISHANSILLHLTKDDEVWVQNEIYNELNDPRINYDSSARYTHFIGYLIFV